MCVREMNFHSVDDIEEAVTGSLVSGLGVLVWFGLVWVKTQREKAEADQRREKRWTERCEMRKTPTSRPQSPEPARFTPHLTTRVPLVDGYLYIFFLYKRVYDL